MMHRVVNGGPDETVNKLNVYKKKNTETYGQMSPKLRERRS